ncbi:hypothetical protein H2200_012034 [Cladophialophora chaetospira]|uniref:Uncharacterized protein n=1 Tax=Cladophialophora chaetospira TaxID=386627 RepID=A0AA38WY50_9EURO|nr:hypothetical protein H2200_012034 [Cladophialophora chaetospira]
MPSKEDQGSYLMSPTAVISSRGQLCAKAGRTCEGYEHYPIFLIRTPEGPARRSHLSEAKAIPRPSSLGRDGSLPNRNDDVSRGGAENFGLPADITNHGAWEAGVVAWFWNSYTPAAAASDTSKGTSIWLYHTVEVSNPTPVLHQALLALSITRYGSVNGNIAMKKRGQAIYGNALRLLQQALYDEVLMLHDETLASVRALVLYELFESTSNDPTAWYRHLAGMTLLMQSRGPRRHCSPIARTVLEDIRYALMLKALMLRKASLFGQDDWLEVPWQDRTKSSEQQVYDLGFHLAVILDRADQLGEAEAYAKPLEETIDLLEACNILQSRLEDLYTNSFKPVLQERRHDWIQSHFNDKPDANALSTADISHIIIVINLWSCQLLLGFVAHILRRRLIEVLEGHLMPADHTEEIESLCNISAEYTSQHALSDLAHAILRYLPSCVGSRASEFAASRTLYPLTCILWQLRHSEAHFLQAIALMRQVSEARNVRFAGAGYSVTAFIPYIVRGDEGLLAAQGPQSAP